MPITYFESDSEEARNQASGILARVRLGDDPAVERSNARKAETVSDLLASFMEDHIRAKRKARTAKLFQGYVDNHIEAALGTRKAPSLTRANIERLHKAIGRTHPVTANRVLSLIGAAYAHGLRSGHLPERMANPASGIKRFRERLRERFLSESELLWLGEAIREAETTGIPWTRQSKSKHAPKPENRVTNIGPHAAAALRLLIFTGARLREILDLQWDHVDLQRGLLFLPDSKTGKKTIVLGAAALAVLENLPHVGQFVIAGITYTWSGKMALLPCGDELTSPEHTCEHPYLYLRARRPDETKARAPGKGGEAGPLEIFGR